MSLGTLDVFFRAERGYIQGSLLVPQAIARANDAGALDLLSEPTIEAVNFREIIDHHCVVSWCDDSAAQLGPALGEILLGDQTREHRVRLRLHRDPSRSQSPPRMPDTAKVIAPFENAEDGSATTKFTADLPGLESFLRGVVEINKRHYEMRFADCQQIIFAALFNSNLPANDERFPAAGTFRLEPLSARSDSSKTSAISRTTLVSDSSPELSAMIVFTFMEARQ